MIPWSKPSSNQARVPRLITASHRSSQVTVVVKCNMGFVPP